MASDFDMDMAVILAALLLTAPAVHGRDAAHRVSGSDPAQAAAPQETPPPQTDPPPSTDATQSESKKEETPPGKKVEEPSPQKAPSAQTPAGARKRRPRAKKSAPLATDGEPRKTVIHRGGAAEPVTQILPGMSQEEASHQRESAEQLLAASENSLKELATRALNPNQQQMLVQIRQYMDVARSALKESDLQRAHTLAQKAYLLSDDLVKHP